MNFFNLHTHTTFCDGKAEPEAFVSKAIEWGYHTLGFSGHAPVPFENKFAIREEHLQDYFDEVSRLIKKYQGQIRILRSLEIDYIPGITRNFSEFVALGKLHYTIGGVHLIRNKEKDDQGLWFIDGPRHETYDEGLQKLFAGNPRKGVEAYFNQLSEMIATQQPDIIAHIDKIKMHNKNRYFSEEEAWYKDLVWKLLKYIAKETSCIIEVNTRGLYKKRSDTFFPGPAILEQIHQLNIPITISTDAHLPDELNGYYQEALDLVKDIGFKELLCFKGEERIIQRID